MPALLLVPGPAAPPGTTSAPCPPPGQPPWFLLCPSTPTAVPAPGLLEGSALFPVLCRAGGAFSGRGVFISFWQQGSFRFSRPAEDRSAWGLSELDASTSLRQRGANGLSPGVTPGRGRRHFLGSNDTPAQQTKNVRRGAHLPPTGASSPPSWPGRPHLLCDPERAEAL